MVANKSTSGSVTLERIKRQRLKVGLKSISPLLMHKWDEKSKGMMRDKHAGKKTKKRDVRDPEAEGKATAYTTADGTLGILVTAVKNAIISAAHKDMGIEKTLVRKALFICCDDPGNVIPIETDSASIVEHTVRVGTSSTDLRYRMQVESWTCVIEFEIDASLLQVDDMLTLLGRAGFGIGIGDWRPEKGGEYGRFEIDTSVPFEARDI